MNEENTRKWATWLTTIAKILSYLATAVAGGLVGAGCKNGALINLC